MKRFIRGFAGAVMFFMLLPVLTLTASASTAAVTTFVLTVSGPYSSSDAFAVHVNINASPNDLTFCVPPGSGAGPACASGRRYTRSLGGAPGASLSYYYERYEGGSLVQMFGNGVVDRKADRTVRVTFTYLSTVGVPATGASASAAALALLLIGMSCSAGAVVVARHRHRHGRSVDRVRL